MLVMLNLNSHTILEIYTFQAWISIDFGYDALIQFNTLISVKIPLSRVEVDG